MRWSLLIPAFAAVGLVLVVSTCQEAETGSTLGRFGREARFPMYFTVAGIAAGEGGVYRIDGVEAGVPIVAQPVLTGLDFPTGIAVDASGAVFFAETLGAPAGRVRKIPAGATAAVDFITGLDFPTGVGVDTFDQVYVLEAGTKKVLRADQDGTSKVLIERDIGNPRAVTIDASDNLFLVELSPNVLSKVLPSGARTVLSPDVVAPSGAALGPTGDTFLLVGNTGASDGQLLRIEAGKEPVEVAKGFINPLAVAAESFGSLYVAEGDPANRILRVSAETGAKTLIVTTGANPYGIAFTPF